MKLMAEPKKPFTRSQCPAAHRARPDQPAIAPMFNACPHRQTGSIVTTRATAGKGGHGCVISRTSAAAPALPPFPT